MTISNHYFKLLYLLILITVLSCNKKDDSKNLIAPTVHIISPTAQSQYHLNDIILLKAEAQDEDGQIESVRFYLGDTLFFEDKEEPYECEYLAKKTNNNLMKVYAIDNDFIKSKIKQSNINVYCYPAPNIVVEDFGGFIYDTDSIQIAVEAISEYAEISYCILIDNIIEIQVDSTFPYEFVYRGTEAGEHRITIKAVDEFGGYKESYAQEVHVIKASPPRISISTPNEDYYLPNQEIRFSVYISGQTGSNMDTVECYLNNENIGSPEEDYFIIENISSGSNTFYIKAIDKRGMVGYSDTVQIDVLRAVPLSQHVIDLEASDQGDLIYGIQQYNNELLLINPDNLQINSLSLPNSGPIDLAFDKFEKLLYILYGNCEYFSIYNQATQQLETIDIPNGYISATKIEIDHQHNRIYVATLNHLLLFNLATKSFIKALEPLMGNQSSYYTENQILFSFKKNENHTQLYQYSLANDALMLKDSISEHCDGTTKQVLVNNPLQQMIAPCNMGYGFYAYDPNNLSNILGQYQEASNPVMGHYSDINESLYMVCGSSSLQVFSAKEFYLTDSYIVPNARYCKSITCSSDGKHVVLYTVSSNYENFLYVYDII